jgi:hypothetical protein
MVHPRPQRRRGPGATAVVTNEETNVAVEVKTNVAGV